MIQNKRFIANNLDVFVNVIIQLELHKTINNNIVEILLSHTPINTFKDRVCSNNRPFGLSICNK